MSKTQCSVTNYSLHADFRALNKQRAIILSTKWQEIIKRKGKLPNNLLEEIQQTHQPVSQLNFRWSSTASIGRCEHLKKMPQNAPNNSAATREFKIVSPIREGHRKLKISTTALSNMKQVPR